MPQRQCNAHGSLSRLLRLRRRLRKTERPILLPRGKPCSSGRLGGKLIRLDDGFLEDMMQRVAFASSLPQL